MPEDEKRPELRIARTLSAVPIATDAYLSEGWLGMVRLVPSEADFERVFRGQCRFHRDHNWGDPIGMMVNPRFEAGGKDAEFGQYLADAQVADTPRGHAYLEEYDAGVRGDMSIGCLLYTSPSPRDS